MFFGRLGNEIIFRSAWQINDPVVTAVFTRGAGVTGHDVRIHVNRINRIGDRDFVFVAENIKNISSIAFRSVGDKNLVIGDVDFAGAIIVLGDCRS